MRGNEFNLENKFRAVAKHLDTTLKEMSVVMGMTPQNLSRIFRANSIETKYLFKISEKYNVPIEFFFSKSDMFDDLKEHATQEDLRDKCYGLEKKLETIKYIILNKEM